VAKKKVCLLLGECKAVWHIRQHQFWQQDGCLGRATLMVRSLVKKLAATTMTNSDSKNGIKWPETRKRRLDSASLPEIGKKHDI